MLSTLHNHPQVKGGSSGRSLFFFIKYSPTPTQNSYVTITEGDIHITTARKECQNNIKLNHMTVAKLIFQVLSRTMYHFPQAIFLPKHSVKNSYSPWILEII